MRAAIQQGYGGPDVVRVAEVPAPTAGSLGTGEVLVRVVAASLNPLDAKLRSGDFRLLMPARMPITLGFDLAGVVEAVGDGVRRLAPGDRVYGMSEDRHGGAHAELVVASEDVLDQIPAGLSFVQAAAVPLAALTALQGLRDKGRARTGSRVLVHGGSGGVGHFAVQIARVLTESDSRADALVGAVAGPDNQQLLASLGAGRVLDYTREQFHDTGERWDVIFDCAPHGATSTFTDVRRALTDDGVYVALLPSPGLVVWWLGTRIARPFGGQRRAEWLMVSSDGGDLAYLSSLIEAGALTPTVSEVFAFDDIARAHEAVASGHARGKVVVLLDDSEGVS
jgi:NADPH:quinone reductase-like Zn-dependent oxidoreductase